MSARGKAVVIATAAAVMLAGACSGGSGSGAARSDRSRVPRFVESAAAAGLTVSQSARRTSAACLFSPERLRVALPQLQSQLMGSSGDMCLPERMSGGAAVADVNGDGALDLYLTNLDGPGHLYRNRGDGRFVDVTPGSGLDQLPAGSNGAAFGDVDNDGRPDLIVTMLATARTYFFHNRDGVHFDEQSGPRGVSLDRPRIHSGFTPTFGDFDNDGWIDLFVTEWSSVEWTVGSHPSDQRLLHNLGAQGRPGVFEDVTDRVGVATEIPVLPVFGFGARLADLDGDGWPDLVLASDFRTSRLFWNEGGRHFVDGTRAAHVGTDENGMGLTVGDYDGDGRQDVFVTSIFGRRPPCGKGGNCGFAISGNRLFHNEGHRRFRDVTSRAGVRDAGWGWGTAFVDGANRGRLDLVTTSGMVIPGDPHTRQYHSGPMRYWSNDGTGHFRDVATAAGLTPRGPGKGLVVFDADGDGRPDVLVVRDGATPLLYRNRTRAAGHWIDVRVVGHGSNRDGIGAVVTVRSRGGRAQTVAIGSVTGFLGQSPYVAHFGLDGARRAAVTVVFPATHRRVRMTVERVDRTITVDEPGT